MASWTQEDITFARRHRREQAKRRGRGGGSLVGIRVAEIERVFVDHWGDVLPEDDAGRDDLFVILNHCAFFAEAVTRMRSATALWAPWMPEDALEDLIADISVRPIRWRADKLAERLGVDDATRTRLQLRTIGALDVTASERLARRKEQDRLAKARQRRDKGLPTRAERAARSPWYVVGISRSTWYRIQARERATLASAA